MRRDLVGERVELRELAHVELAAFDAQHAGAQLGRPTEAHDDRGRRREQLGLEPEPIAARAQAVFEPMCGRAVAMERPAERQDEADGRVVRAGHLGSNVAESTNARAATLASERSL